jgi:Ca2+-binding RTX toxin-like protein
MRYLYLAAAAGLALVALAVPASAATNASIQGDTLTVTGDNAGDTVTLARTAPNGPDLGVDENGDGTADQTFALADFTKISVNAGGGDDTVTINDVNGAFTDTKPTTIDGGDGNDKLVGGNGAETINGGAGDDQIDPNRGNDIDNGGPGNDSFTWDPGDGSDTDEGGDGVDVLNFDGANVNEIFTFAPNGDRVTMHRDVANITMDLGTLERVKLLELGGDDTLTASPGLGALVLDADGGAGADTFNGSDEPDVFAGRTENDIITGGGGKDNLSGGADADVLHGSEGDDTINGDGGDDQLFGDAGTDTLDGGDGADVVHCGGPGDTVAIDVNDLISVDCLPFPVPAGNGGGQGNGGNTPPATTTTTSGQATQQQGQGQQVQVQTGLAAGTRGFAHPRIKTAGANLKVHLVNTAAQPIHVSVSAKEKIGRKTFALGKVSATLAPGQARTLVLHPSNAARNALHGRRTRHPVITVRNVDTGGALTLKARVK